MVESASGCGEGDDAGRLADAGAVGVLSGRLAKKTTTRMVSEIILVVVIDLGGGGGGGC
jgi:hypothetical protein